MADDDDELENEYDNGMRPVQRGSLRSIRCITDMEPFEEQDYATDNLENNSLYSLDDTPAPPANAPKLHRFFGNDSVGCMLFMSLF